MASPNLSSNGDTGTELLRDLGGLNIGYAAELLERYRSDPAAVPPSDRPIIGGPQGNGAARPHLNGNGANAPTARVVRPAVPARPVGPALDAATFDRLKIYAEAVRDFGYRAASLDPLGLRPTAEPLMSPETHGVTEQDLQISARTVETLAGDAVSGRSGPLGSGATAGDLIERLRSIYCGASGYEFAHVRSGEERAWLRRHVESGDRVYLSDEQKRYLLDLLTRAETFEHFLHRAYPGQRWYSLEGLESMIVLLDQLVLYSSHTEIENIVLGMAHRGRLNVLAHIFNKPYEDIVSGFAEGHFAQLATLEASGWMTDVKYHQGARVDRDVDGDGTADVRILMLPNPSHLEMVDPVVPGAVRAMQDASGSPKSSMGVIVHGDAAFAGQGVVAETLNLAQLPGYRTGGTIHIIANNQIGFTTEPQDSYSTEHASDVARGFDIPVVHVNADDVDACVAAAKLAIAYRQRFNKDFLIDLVGYRRFGHNENDEPGFTQPVLYKRIELHPTVRAIWSDAAVADGAITREDADALPVAQMTALQAIKEKVDSERSDKPDVPPDLGLARNRFHGLEYAESAVPAEELEAINRHINSPPQGFTPHPTVSRLLARRMSALTDGNTIDWGHAEALALGSILMDGHDIRLTGQDVRRGTFSHRHAALYDFETGEPWVALDGFGKSRFWINNSPLSEVATIGFEQGYSVMSSHSLVMWEAQFGDFVNNAQSVVDEMVVSARDKWDQPSGLVLLLPHGYEGQGPNHSHAHIERFLALAAKNNIRIAYPTTAAQYFHLLRSQAAMLQDDPIPLIVMTGKSLLRHPLAAATCKQLSSGGFRPVIRYQKPGTKLEDVTKVIFCTGKVFVDLVSHDDFERADGVSVIRFEELYPFPAQELERQLKKLPNAAEFTWLQEEPQNRGAWSFIRPRLENGLQADTKLRYVGRPATPSPAEGSNWLHKMQQEHLVRVTLGAEEAVSEFV